MKKLLTTSLNKLLDEFNSAKDNYILDQENELSFGKVCFSLSDLSKSHLPPYLESVFDNKDFPFLSLNSELEEVDILNLHSRAVIAYFYSDFELVKHYVKVFSSYKPFDEGVRELCYYFFIKGYKSGLQEFEGIVQRNMGALIPPSAENTGSVLYEIMLEHDMRNDPILFTSVEAFYNHGYKNAIFFLCWENLHKEYFKPFLEKIQTEVLLRDGRIKLDIDIEKARKYFEVLLNFEHNHIKYQIFSEEQLDLFLRANFFGFGDKAEFEPIKLPKKLKVAIRRHFGKINQKCHSKSHIKDYISLLMKNFIDFKDDNYLSLYSNFSKNLKY